MHRVSIKIERSTGAAYRRSSSVPPEERYASELAIVANCPDVLAGLDKAIRLLTSERDALLLRVAKSGSGVQVDPEEDLDEEEEED